MRLELPPLYLPCIAPGPVVRLRTRDHEPEPNQQQPLEWFRVPESSDRSPGSGQIIAISPRVIGGKPRNLRTDRRHGF